MLLPSNLTGLDVLMAQGASISLIQRQGLRTTHLISMLLVFIHRNSLLAPWALSHNLSILAFLQQMLI